MLLYGNAERAVVELAHRLARGEGIRDVTDIRGIGFMRQGLPAGWTELDSTRVDEPGQGMKHPDPYAAAPECPSGTSGNQQLIRFEARPKGLVRSRTVVRLPSYDQVANDNVLYAHASRVFHLETNPGNARALVQQHGKRDVWLNPPPIPLQTRELDRIYELPYTRKPHPA